MLRRKLLVIGFLGVFSAGLDRPGIFARPAAREPFSTGRVGFSVKFKDEISPYRIMGIFVLPGEEHRFEAIGSGDSARFEMRAESGFVTRQGPCVWLWKAPVEKGVYPLEIHHQGTGEVMHFTVFVLVPFDELKGEYINGYRIGAYPKNPLKGLSIYKPRSASSRSPRGIRTRRSPPILFSGNFCASRKADIPSILC